MLGEKSPQSLGEVTMLQQRNLSHVPRAARAQLALY